MASPIDNIGRWVTKQQRLLQLERSAEKAEIADALAELEPLEAQSRGLSLLSLAVLETSTALYCRTCVAVGAARGGDTLSCRAAQCL